MVTLSGRPVHQTGRGVQTGGVQQRVEPTHRTGVGHRSSDNALIAERMALSERSRTARRMGSGGREPNQTTTGAQVDKALNDMEKSLDWSTLKAEAQ